MTACRNKCVFSFCVLILVVGIGSASAQTVSWTGNGDGQSWHDPANWSTGALPGPVDDVIINVAGSVTVVHSTGTDTINSLVSNESVELRGGSLSITGVSRIVNTFSLTGGILEGTGDLEITGQFDWQSGQMRGFGTTVAKGGVALSGTGTKTLGEYRTLESRGTSTWTDSGNINMHATATFLNRSGAVFDIRNDRSLSSGTFRNEGSVIKSQGAGTTTISSRFDNAGLLLVQTGTLSLTGGGTSAGEFNVELPGELLFGGGDHALLAASNVSADGLVRFSTGTIYVGGGYVAATTELVGGTVLFNAAAETTNLVQSGGVLSGIGTVTVNGTLTWQGGTMSGSGTTIAASTLAIEGAGAKSITEARTLDNAGTATWTDNGNISCAASAMFVNRSGAVLDIRNDRSFSNGMFRNEGTVLKTQGSATTTISARFDNSGNIRVQSGTVTLSGGGESGGTFAAVAPSSLYFGGGTHTLTASSDVSGDGTIRFVSGTIYVGGDYAVTTTEVTGGAVEFDVPVTMVDLQQSGGTIEGVGTIAVSGNLLWQGGTMDGFGKTVAQTDLTIEGAGSKSLRGQRTLENAGTAIWTGTGGVSGTSGTAFVNRPGAVLDIRNDEILSAARFVNDGAVLKSQGSATTTISGTLEGVGSMTVSSGTLTLNGGGAAGMTFVVNDTTTLNFAGGDFILAPPTTLGGDGTVRFSGGTSAVSGTYNPALTEIAAGTVRFDTSVTTTNLLQTGGTMSGLGTVTADSIVWQGGTMDGSGRTIATTELVVEGSSGKSLLDDRTFENAGNAMWLDTGNVTLSADALFVNRVGAVFEIQNDESLSNGTFQNLGTVTKTTGSAATIISSRFDNTGELRILAGTVSLRGGGESSGVFHTAEGMALIFGGGVHVLSAQSDVRGGGTVRVSSGEVYFGGAYTLDTTEIAAGTANFNTNAQTTDMQMTGGVLAGTGPVTVLGTLDWQGGTMSGSGTTTVETVLDMNGTSTKGLTERRTLVNLGTATWSGTGVISSAVGARFVNRAGAVFDVQNDRSYSSGTFENAGTFRKSDGPAVSTFSAEFNNSGTVEALSGTLRFNGPYTQTAGLTYVDTGSFEVSTSYVLLLRGGTLGGPGSIVADVVNYAGDVSPGASPGTFSISGTYAQGGRGSYSVEIENIGSYDILDVTGHADLGGVLNITVVEPFVPSSGDAFEIMTFASRSGEFQDVHAPCLGGGLVWVRDYTDTSVTLRVLPGPDGDFNGDGSVTLADAAAFATCMGGPGAAASSTCANAFDFNLDDDVDASDFACFELAFTTP